MMQTVSETLMFTRPNAHIAIRVLKAMEAEGLGNNELYMYSGSATPATIKSHLTRLGMRKQYPEKIIVGGKCYQGHKVYIALTNNRLKMDFNIYTISEESIQVEQFKGVDFTDPKCRIKLLRRILESKGFTANDVDATKAQISLLQANDDLLNDLGLFGRLYVHSKNEAEEVVKACSEVMLPLETVDELIRDRHFLRSEKLTEMLFDWRERGFGNCQVFTAKATIGRKTGNIHRIDYYRFDLEYKRKFEIIEYRLGARQKGDYVNVHFLVRPAKQPQ